MEWIRSLHAQHRFLFTGSYRVQRHFRTTGNVKPKRMPISVTCGTVGVVEAALDGESRGQFPSCLCHPLVKGMILGDLSQVT